MDQEQNCCAPCLLRKQTFKEELVKATLTTSKFQDHISCNRWLYLFFQNRLVNFWDKNLIFGIWLPYIQRQLDLSGQVTKNKVCFLGTPGDISSDLYRPQSQDEIVEFSFFVALSYESNLQLGCFWWKISTSSLKTFFYKFTRVIYCYFYRA